MVMAALTKRQKGKSDELRWNRLTSGTLKKRAGLFQQQKVHEHRQQPVLNGIETSCCYGACFLKLFV